MVNNIITFLTLVFSAITLAFIVYSIYLYKKTKPKNNQRAEISGQRERIENKIYDMQEIMYHDSKRLFDNTNLLLQFSPQDLEIDNTVPNLSFFKGMGIDIDNITVKENRIFCLMPFNKRFDAIHQSINLCCTNSGYELSRSDVPYNPGNILKQILQQLLEAQLVIAVLDGKNPNVFYEIGIAHSIGKKVILIAKSDQIENIPFDLQSNRLLLYSSYRDLELKLTTVLKNIHNVKR